MAFDNEDRTYLDDKFGEVHERISGAKREITDLRVSMAEVCPWVDRHEKTYHNTARFLGMLAAITAVVGTLLGGAVWLIKAVVESVKNQ